MNRGKHKFVLEIVGIDTVRKLEFYYGNERFSFRSLLHEHNRQQAEKAIDCNFKYNHIRLVSGYSNSGIKKIKKEFLSIKKK